MTNAAYMTALSQEPLLHFVGHLTAQHLDAILAEVEHKLIHSEPNRRLQKRIFSIFIECLQNVYLHAQKYTDFNQDHPFSLQHEIRLYKTSEGYFIETSNPVSYPKVSSIQDQLERLNSLTRKDLEQLYLQAWQRARFMPEKGAGLGLIDIARRCGSKLEYHFNPINGKTAFFTLKVKVLEQVA